MFRQVLCSMCLFFLFAAKYQLTKSLIFHAVLDQSKIFEQKWHADL